MTDRNDILEMAQGHLGRVLAIRLRPGTDVLKGLEENRVQNDDGEMDDGFLK